MLTMPPIRPKRAPSHRPTMTIPHEGTYLIADVKPLGRAKGLRGYCKYCYRTHKQWWLMPPEEYPSLPLAGVEGASRPLLCGYCEHVSHECFV